MFSSNNNLRNCFEVVDKRKISVPLYLEWIKKYRIIVSYRCIGRYKNEPLEAPKPLIYDLEVNDHYYRKERFTDCKNCAFHNDVHQCIKPKNVSCYEVLYKEVKDWIDY